MTALLGPADIRALASRLGVSPTKTLGQNFVHDPNTVRRIVRVVDPEPGSSKPDAILSVDNITRHFGGITAVDVDHLEVQRGIITALIGPNGAGKTTFFNLITGFDRPSSGQEAHWSFDGATLDRTSASRVAIRTEGRPVVTS